MDYHKIAHTIGCAIGRGIGYTSGLFILSTFAYLNIKCIDSLSERIFRFIKAKRNQTLSHKVIIIGEPSSIIVNKNEFNKLADQLQNTIQDNCSIVVIVNNKLVNQLQDTLRNNN